MCFGIRFAHPGVGIALLQTGLADLRRWLATGAACDLRTAVPREEGDHVGVLVATEDVRPCPVRLAVARIEPNLAQVAFALTSTRIFIERSVSALYRFLVGSVAAIEQRSRVSLSVPTPLQPFSS